MCFLPSTVQSSIAFTSVAKGNVAAAVISASFSNLVGMFITPIMVSLFIFGQTQHNYDATSSIITNCITLAFAFCCRAGVTSLCFP